MDDKPKTNSFAAMAAVMTKPNENPKSKPDPDTPDSAMAAKVAEMAANPEAAAAAEAEQAAKIADVGQAIEDAMRKTQTLGSLRQTQVAPDAESAGGYVTTKVHKFISLRIQQLKLGDFVFDNFRYQTDSDEDAEKLMNLLKGMDGPTQANVHYLGLQDFETVEVIRQMDREMNNGIRGGAIPAPALRTTEAKAAPGMRGPMTSSVVSDAAASGPAIGTTGT